MRLKFTRPRSSKRSSAGEDGRPARARADVSPRAGVGDECRVRNTTGGACWQPSEPRLKLSNEAISAAASSHTAALQPGSASFAGRLLPFCAASAIPQRRYTPIPIEARAHRWMTRSCLTVMAVWGVLIERNLHFASHLAWFLWSPPGNSRWLVQTAASSRSYLARRYRSSYSSGS